MKRILRRHAAMVLDHRRTVPLLKAMTSVVTRDSVVLDIGTGMGLLAFAAVRAGAKYVYAIDADGESLEVARRLAAQFGMTDRICFIEGFSQTLELDTRVDVMVCETIGSAACDENILLTLSDAKKRLLRRGGKIIPERLELFGVPVRKTIKKNFLPKLSFKKICDVDFPQIKKSVQTVERRAFLCAPKKLSSLSLRERFPTRLHTTTTFRVSQKSPMVALALWPKIIWAKNFVTDASPLLPLTHWGQRILPLRRQHSSHSTFRLEMIIQPDESAPFHKTELLWRVHPNTF